MGLSANGIYSWEEVRKHNKKDDKWLVISGHVYDVTNWSKKHPGGDRILTLLAGQDATEGFRAFHNDFNHVSKYLSSLRVGELDDVSKGQKSEIDHDFENLRKKATGMGLYKANYLFYAMQLCHIIVLEILAYLVMKWCGIGWIPYFVSMALYTTMQTQTGWLQHDFGHLSVFHNTKMDHFFHHLTMGFTKAGSGRWWSHVHNQHHVKPNVINKDPDIRVELLFVLGDVIPIEVAKRWRNSMPYNLQHRYFFIIGPPLLIPLYFPYLLLNHVIKRRLWVDFLCIIGFYVKFFLMYTPLLGVTGCLVFYFIAKCLDSMWFTWVSQCNHIPMSIEHDGPKPWLALQLQATCDIEKSLFNDWFTGHLNFQIEHHLFPTMPRHNYYKIAPYVKELCDKHGVRYQVKPLWTAFKDIVTTLRKSGSLWKSTYEDHHLHKQ